MCPHKISYWAKMHFPLVLLCVASSEEIKGKKKNLLCWAKKSLLLCAGIRLAISLVITFR